MPIPNSEIFAPIAILPGRPSFGEDGGTAASGGFIASEPDSAGCELVFTSAAVVESCDELALLFGAPDAPDAIAPPGEIPLSCAINAEEKPVPAITSMNVIHTINLYAGRMLPKVSVSAQPVRRRFIVREGSRTVFHYPCRF